ncbi:hypothetical protein GPA19_05475 [Azoarcus indigens]|uniref:Uncharacterized protein n=1 Tax=Azoarcus indigens TaxID=29545 RepID=A0A4R6DV99_9RHOO|nr:hypothetical protein [Azoarcus indigens]NMG64396.1 hypothetical protein [Azoarcus indigens]TDN49150.1 hypothetical protein C7389_1121 [Azoarcus indigens]
MTMMHAQLMRKDGEPLPRDQVQKQKTYSGDFTIDLIRGIRRLRLYHVWASRFEPIELYQPVLINAKQGWQIWQGYENADGRGVVQEWFVRTSEH